MQLILSLKLVEWDVKQLTDYKHILIKMQWQQIIKLKYDKLNQQCNITQTC